MPRWTIIVTGVALLGLISTGVARAAREGQPCIPEPTDELIAYSDLRTCMISPIVEFDIFRFVGAIGEIVRIVATEGDGFSGSPDVCLDLRRPDGTPIGPIVCHEVSVALETTLDQAGEYIMLISEAGGDQTMNYTIMLERIFPPSPTNTPVESGIPLSSGMIAPIGDLDLYSFQGQVGDLIRIDAAEGDGFSGSPDVCIDLRSPDGTRIGSVVCGEVAAAIEVTLDQDGEHIFIISEAGGDQEMNFTVVYTCILGACLSLTRPVCDVALSQETYTDGEIVEITTAQARNPGDTQVSVEVKVSAVGPDGHELHLVNKGAKGSFILAPGEVAQSPALTLMTVTPETPRGSYVVSCRLLNPTTGDLLALDQASFDVVDP